MTAADNQAQSRQSIEHIAERAAEKAVRETLLLFGIDTRDPIKAQEDFVALRKMAVTLNSPKVQGDLAFLSRLHSASDTVKDTSFRTITRVLVSAALGGVAIATKDWWLAHLANIFTTR